MSRLYLGLVLHNHQPVGNYGFVIEDVYEKAYQPMLEALERHPGVRVALHTSGCLFDWIDRHRPEYIERLRLLCDRGQVELLTGGYYEPVLPMISDADKLGQIRKLSEYIEERFAQHPTGLWLTERVWEPGLPSPLADAGVQWTLVDDEHFRLAGMRDEQLDGYFITEDQGKRVALFPGSQRLRYTIPWLNVDDLMAELRRYGESATAEAPYLVLGDDGEKFGAWPTTYAHVWEQGWIERFFTAIESAADWLEMITPGEYMRRFDACGLTYLPAASYAEMMEWAMPAASSAAYRNVMHQLQQDSRSDVLAFVRGGFWRYFLAKYPEVNTMHKRGLRVGEKLGDAGNRDAREALWAAQCNCPYWHGVFGGLYLRHIRRATNTNLVRAERLADEASGGSTGVRVSRGDIDFDGHEEILVQTPATSLLVHPKLGGMISEWDLRRRDLALLDVLARRREAYHDAQDAAGRSDASGDATNIHGDVRVKEEGLARALVFDRYRRGGLQEWILAPEATVEQFSRGEAPALMEPHGAWTAVIHEAATSTSIKLSRESGDWRLTKEITLPSAGERLGIRYACTNVATEQRSAIFVSEWNLSPPQSPDGDDRTALIEADAGSVDAAGPAGGISSVRAFAIRGSAAYALGCDADAAIDVWHFPVESISSSEGGVERVFQGISVSVVRRLDLAPGETAEFSLAWSVEE
ncbi:MAG: DUF1926 domain-containing protein [Chloroflexi bacterium]|nr:DUF1926 domain-containing protein [Chloroflexota bacterium]